MKAILSEIGTEYCPKPYVWMKSDFQKYYGIPFMRIKPIRAREGYACIGVRDDAQSVSKAAWNEATEHRRDESEDELP